jgi:predicted dehydrogenase
MWAACRDAQVAHYVPFWTRYIPVFARARQLVSAGALGEVKVVIYRWHNPRPAAIPFTWRDDAGLSSAGSIADVGSHAYDVVRWILGTEAKRVLAHAGVITPERPDLGAIDLAEALDWGRTHAGDTGGQTRKSSTFDYAAIAVEFENEAVGTFLLSHATYLRKGLAPELELHGTKSSLSIDRLSGAIASALPDQDVQTLETLPDPGFGNRFLKHVFPAMRKQLSGAPCDHPDLKDGYHVQLFTDAAALSSREGGWRDLAGLKDASRVDS